MYKYMSIVLGLLFFFLGGMSASAQTIDGSGALNVSVTANTAITNFEQCVKAGYGVQRSYPGRCVTADGKVFTQVNANADVRATGTAQMKADAQRARAEMEMRAKAMRASTTAAIKDMRGEFKENHAEMRMEIEARAKALRASTTKAIGMMKDGDQKKRFEHASKKAHAVVERLNAAIARVQKLSDRVAERLTKLEAEGVVTTAARAHLTEAKIALSLAATQTANIKLSIETTLAGAATSTTKTEAKEAFKQTHELVKDATKTIKEAHNHVALAISSIKPGQNKPRPGTTTVPVSGSVNGGVGATTTTQ